MNINICIEDMVELLVHVALLLKIKKQSLKKNNNMDMYSSFHVVKKKIYITISQTVSIKMCTIDLKTVNM